MSRVIRRVLIFGLLAGSLGTAIAVAGIGRWTASGPEGGLVLSLAVDPANAAVAYAGTQSGGIFKTSDSGARWSFSGLGSLSVSAIVADPSNGKTLYAAAGNAVFKTSDAGQSWRDIGGGLPLRGETSFDYAFVTSLAVDPLVPSILYAGLTKTHPGIYGYVFVEGGLFKSLDAGETWTATGLTDGGVARIAVDPTDSRILYAVVHASGKYAMPHSIRRSADGGLTWSVIRDDFSFGTRITALAIGGRNPVTVEVSYADFLNKGVIEKTTDGGQTWSVVGSLPEDLGVSDLLIDPSDASLVYAASEGVFKSADGAATWSRVLDLPFTRCLSGTAADPARLYACTGDGVATSADAGASWKFGKAGLIATSIQQLQAGPRSRDELYARSGLDVFHSADGGASWQLAGTIPSDLSPMAFAVSGKEASVQYIGATNGGLCRGVAKTSDGGTSWTQTSLTTGCILRIASDPQNADTVYAVGQFGLWKSADAGGSWSGTILAQPISAFAIAPSAPAEIYAAITGQGVLASRDGGQTWSPTGEGLTGVRTLAVDPVNPATVYAASDGGLFKSDDRGATWRETGGMKGVNALAIDPARPSTVYAAAGPGVFRSADGGVSFALFSDGLTNPSVSGLVIDASGRFLHAATQGGGVFDYALLPERSVVAPQQQPRSPRALKVRP